MPRANCPHCGDLLSYPKNQAGEVTDCPYCDHEIALPPHVPKSLKNIAVVVSLLGTLAAVGFVTYVVWAVFQNFDIGRFNTERAGILLQFVMGFLAVVIILLWIVFPVFVYHFLGRIARATESSESLLQIISKNTGSR
jgi:uncharacterized paraquat-inducible protein A